MGPRFPVLVLLVVLGGLVATLLILTSLCYASVLATSRFAGASTRLSRNETGKEISHAQE